MTDDIVTRLHENCGCYAANEFGYNCTNCDAADEIERLRAERDRWTRCAERLVEWQDKDGFINALEFYRENQRLDMEAVNRGE